MHEYRPSSPLLHRRDIDWFTCMEDDTMTDSRRNELIDMICNHCAFGRNYKALLIAQYLRRYYSCNMVVGLTAGGYRR